MFFNNNFAGAGFGYSTPGNANSDFNSYPFEVTNDESSTSAAQTSGSELDSTLAGISTTEIEDWWLAPRPDSGASQYMGSTLLDYPCDEFTGVYESQADPIPYTGAGEFLLSVINTRSNTDNTRRRHSRF